MSTTLSTRIRSFVRREGRNSKRQAHAWETFWPQFGLSQTEGLLDLDNLFSRHAPRIVEIGFGKGESLLAQAKAHPEQDYIGIEVYRTGVAHLLHQLAAEHITNVRLFCADAVEVLQRCLPPESLDAVLLYFPDPWPKKRHHKRRLVQAPFVSAVADRLKTGGLFHMATDWEPYAQWMRTVMEESAAFENIAGKNQFSPRPEQRTLTRFEQRGHRLGHEVWDLLYRKHPAP